MTQLNRDPGDEDDLPEWADQLMRTVAAEVRRRRKELRLSAQDLADRCTEIGHPIPRNVIANMESGRRSHLPLADVIVLAKALNTYPVCLIYPVGYVPDVQRLPLRHEEPTWDAMHWFTGSVPDGLGVEDGMLRSYRAHMEHERRAVAAVAGEERERWRAETAAGPAEREEALRDRERYAERALDAKSRLRAIRAISARTGAPLLRCRPS
ncbi:helix-turn-helix domain-containing protein [Streptomyces sp. NPDC059076]|uniref:helix-turn-helix domain-containing protein n=1 Tax=unclassified Streptomyces TaxID=2593676 RepID=UPI0036CB056D